MELKKHALYLLAAGMIATGGSASAADLDKTGFTALGNAAAQSLSQQEMQAVAGELNAGQISAALTSWASQTTNACLSTTLTRLAGAVTTYSSQINATLQKVGLYTP
jgi:hypothetical protein